MSERKWHTVGSSDFKPGFGRWQRGESLAIMAALGLGLIAFRLLDSVAGLPIWICLVAATLIPVGVAVFLLCLVSGKPRGHAVDTLEWQWMRLTSWLENHGADVNSKPLIEIPDNEKP
jgi:hypothetical protein